MSCSVSRAMGDSQGCLGKADLARDFCTGLLNAVVILLLSLIALVISFGHFVSHLLAFDRCNGKRL